MQESQEKTIGEFIEESMFTMILDLRTIVKLIVLFCATEHLPKRMLQSFASAWSLVKDKLRDHGRTCFFYNGCVAKFKITLPYFNNFVLCPARVKVEQRFLDDLQNISESTTLQYLIPTTVGPGACSFALVDYLVLQHNNFIEMCQGVAEGDDRR